MESEKCRLGIGDMSATGGSLEAGESPFVPCTNVELEIAGFLRFLLRDL